MKKLLVMGLLAGLASPAMADFPMGKVGLNMAPSAKVDFDGTDDTGNGFGFYGEVGGDTLFVFADYQLSSVDFSDIDVDYKETRVGGGLRSASEKTTLIVRVESYKGEIDSDLGSGDDSGLGIHAGGDLAITNTVGIYGDFGFLSLDDTDGTELRLGVRSSLTENSEVYAGYRQLSLDDSGVELDVSDIKLGINVLF